MGESEGGRYGQSCDYAQETNDVSRRSPQDRRGATRPVGEGERSEEGSQSLIRFPYVQARAPLGNSGRVLLCPLSQTT